MVGRAEAILALFLRGEGILPLSFGRDERVVARQSEAKMASPRKGGTPSPRKLKNFGRCQLA